MPVPMLDLRAQYAALKPDIDAVVAEVFATQQFRGGPFVERFEAAMAEYAGVAHAVGVASGTDALLLIFKALELLPGDEIVTTPFTFFATAGAIVNAGAKPVFADIRPDCYTLDPERAEAAITPRTRAVVPVHLYGQCADMEAIHAMAARRGLPVIEDAAQALGARRHGKPAGSLGRAAALSFYPTKNLGAAGEGGMVLTDDAALAQRVRLLRAHGADTTYVHRVVGFNSHLHSVQAAVLGVKLPHLDAWNDARRDRAAYYTEKLRGLADVVTPAELPDNHHVYHQYVIRAPRRDEARARFQEAGVGCGVFYPLPLHRQECFTNGRQPADDCPEAERASREVLALPIYPELTRAQQDLVIDAIRAHIQA